MNRSDAEKPFVSIVIPVFNSEATLTPLVDELAGLGAQYRIEIILVNDASTDRSEEICAALYEKHRHVVKALSLFPNAGEYPAVMAGLKHAQGDFVVTMDDDGQNPPSEVPPLVEPLLKGECDVTYGAYPRKRQAFWRKLVSKTYNAAACFALKKPRELYLSSFRAMNRPLLDTVLRENYAFPYVDARIFRRTKRIGQVLVRHEPRKAGRSGYTPVKLLRLFISMMLSLREPPHGRAEESFTVRRSWGIGENRA
ncbi:MAG TPA: glycosyltransferase [Verrucomicrobiae bacterium]|jgi:undecaprenyl-phosphate 4-deoxy-4-formamido-L-arabinose transferase|nr:glycosyltransferase [Verrucomicrobiae bacterium]